MPEMKNIENLETPTLLLDLTVLENNIKTYQQVADDYSKELWPMIKTHKCTEIALLQQEAGAAGFLCGTLDECEALIRAGIKNIMYAYPVVSEPNISRMLKIAKACNFVMRIDDLRQAKILNEYALSSKMHLNYTIIINSGLNRFGIEPKYVMEFACKMQPFKNLIFKGICTHLGHVYGASDYEGVISIAKEEMGVIKTAYNLLKNAGHNLEFVSSGSTPTFLEVAKNTDLNKLYPGNYVFMDNIQIALGVAKEQDCALTVLATVIANPRSGTYIIDAGSKCFGLDKGAHGGDGLVGYGLIKNYPELTLDRLSEEVGVITGREIALEIGEKIQIIPNHSCSAANMASYYICKRGDFAVGSFRVDMRNNAKNKIYTTEGHKI